MSSGLFEEDKGPAIHKKTEDRLVYMANQMVDFFSSQGSEEKAVVEVADHIKSFWDPAMRRRIFAHLDATGGEGLKPIALSAVKVLRQTSGAQLQTVLEAMGEHSGREPGDDAG